MKKVVYTAQLPFLREGRPVGARFETEDDFVPHIDMEVIPTDEVTLYVEKFSYNPHNKTAYVELTFLDPRDEQVGDLLIDLDARELAELEIAIEALIAAGWLPIDEEDLGRSSGETTKRSGQTH